jgi:predicted HicB family RNase H-like nuclease
MHTIRNKGVPMPEKTEKPNQAVLYVRMDPLLHSRIKAQAKRLGLTLAGIVKMAITKLAEEEEAGQYRQKLRTERP